MVAHHEDEDEQAGREHRQRGDILSDREYSCDPAWQQRMFEAGFTPHFLLTKYQREQVLTLPSGIVIIDGIPYSPGIPKALRISPTPDLLKEGKPGQQVLPSTYKESRIALKLSAEQELTTAASRHTAAQAS